MNNREMESALERVRGRVDFYAAVLAGEYTRSNVIDPSNANADLRALVAYVDNLKHEIAMRDIDDEHRFKCYGDHPE